MSVAASFLLALSLALDALAVAIALAVAANGLPPRQVVTVGLYFGGFQWMMTINGWLLGHGLSGLVAGFDHWLVFAILGGIGLKMLLEARKPAAPQGRAPLARLSSRLLTWLALATSLDALAAGVSVAFLKANIALVAAIVGLVAFGLSAAGAALGQRLSRLLQQKALTLGGLILILIALKTLLEHLFD